VELLVEEVEVTGREVQIKHIVPLARRVQLSPKSHLQDSPAVGLPARESLP